MKSRLYHFHIQVLQWIFSSSGEALQKLRSGCDWFLFNLIAVELAAVLCAALFVLIFFVR